jgi:hypothetical protein
LCHRCRGEIDREPGAGFYPAEEVVWVCPQCGGLREFRDAAGERTCRECRQPPGDRMDEWYRVLGWAPRTGILPSTLPFDLLRAYAEWPAVQHLSCTLFSHQIFDINTCNRLIAWLEYRAGDGADRMPRTNVVDMLEAELATKRRAQPPIDARRPVPPIVDSLVCTQSLLGRVFDIGQRKNMAEYLKGQGVVEWWEKIDPDNPQSKVRVVFTKPEDRAKVERKMQEEREKRRGNRGKP